MRRAACLSLAVALLSTSAPAAPLVINDLTSAWRGELGFRLRTAGLFKSSLFGAQGSGNSRAAQERQEDRDTRVRRVKIYPGDVTVRLNERVTFSAQALDGDDQPIGGVAFKWSAVEEGGHGHATRTLLRGEFKSVVPGTFRVTAEAGGRKDEVRVTVIRGDRHGSVDPSGHTFSSHGHSDGTSSAKPARRGRRRSASPIFVKASLSASALALPPVCSDDSQWNECNYPGGSDPGNRRGNPPGSPVDQGAGNGNFQIAAPVLTLPGRGLDVALGLVYNSRVWTKNSTDITYDIDHDWPAAGWSLGLGRMNDLGNGGGMIEDADGTRHAFTGSRPANSVTTTLHTTDGTFVDYTTMINEAGVIVNAQAWYPNGTIIWYGAGGGGALYPTTINDANGNYVTVTYVGNTGPQIQTITDTLGRTVNFYYDSNNLLTAVTGPALTSGTRTLVRLHYKQLPTLSATFTGLTPVVRNYTPWALDAIYYPATSTGYWFGDTDSYSSYGMIEKVVEQRGMSFSASSLNDQGTVTQGTMSEQQVYGFQTSNLTDAPTFTSLTESYDGMETAPAVTSFSAQPNASPRTVTITMPDQTQSVQYSYNHSGSYDDGLVYRDETKDSAGSLLRSSDVVWEQGAYESPRPVSTTATNEQTHQRTGTEFSYGSSYNQVAEARAYDYGYTYGGTSNALLRRVVTSYNSATGYISNHIFNLPASVETYDGTGARMSRTEYQYDGVTMANTPNVTAHNPNYDPYNTDTVGGDECCEWGEGPDGFQFCQEMCPAQPVFHQETNYRGLVTQVTSYSNVTSQQASGAITETRTYDITGNMVTATTSCCQQMSFEYTLATQYAYPESKTRGAATDALNQVKISAAYDFNTGLTINSTDANGLTSTTGYYADTLRTQTVTLPTTGHTDYSYDDAAMTVTEATYLSAGANGLANQSVEYLNGAGAIKQEKVLGAGGVWDYVDTHYDQMGRVSTQSRPYNSSTDPTIQLTTYHYDALGRVQELDAPDGSVTQAYFDEINAPHQRPNVASSAPGDTTLIVDAWGRERWGRYDALGRLVEVVEPNPDLGGSTATGGWLTTYTYDAMGRLKGTNQGGQVRSFAYDSLGRLTRQKLAEATATLNDSGNYVGAGMSGAQWSDAFTYDDHSNLTRRVDARGVVTNFDYNDPLNRLQSISYDLTGAHENLANSPINAAPTVTYTYRTKASGSDLIDITQLNTVTATLNSAVVSAESYIYDTQGRVGACTLTLNGRPSMRTDYSYDNLDRMTDVLYPAENLQTGAGRKTVHQDYDVESRLSGLKVDGADYASGIIYNAASQTKQLKVGAAGTNQVTESYDYDSQTGLLSHQKAQRLNQTGSPTLLDLSYDYLRAGTTSGRTGQLTRITNNIDSEKGRTYSYDALGRLTHASGGDPTGAPLWTQSYSYDRWGNRTGVAASGFTAQAGKPGGSQSRTEVAANHTPPLPEFYRTDDKRQVSDAPDSPALFGTPNNTTLGALLLDSPTNLQVTQTSGATQTTSAQVTLQWSAPAGAVDHYRIERRDSSGQYSFVANVPASQTTYADTGVTSGAAYLYRVRAVDSSGVNSSYSNVALGTAYTFTDDPIVTIAEDPSGATVTRVRALHITELRQAVNAVRHLAGMGDYAWTDQSVTSGSPIAAADVTDLRTALGAALTALNLPLPTYTDATIYNGQGGQHTVVKRDHVKQLRDAATRGKGTTSGGSGTPVPSDGLDGLTYDSATNRINSAGWEYDAAGNQTRTRVGTNTWQRYEYDAANRLVKVLTDDRQTVLATYTYGESNERLIADEGGLRTYYATGALEYVEAGASTQPQWSKSYVYLGARLLSVITPNGSGGEYVEYHHPDRLGTRIVTNNAGASFYEQTTLPFGTALDAESTGATNRRFTSYDHSQATGLEYAVNRYYDSQQGRFTKVDPIGMGGASLFSPQTFNLYSYCGNDPINNTDPSGLFWGKLFHFIGKALKWIGIAAMVATAIISVVGLVAGAAALHTFLTTTLLGKILGFIANIPSLIGSKIIGAGNAIAGVFSFAGDGEMSAIAVGVVGSGVIAGGSAVAGAIYRQTRAQQQILDRNRHWRNRKYWPRGPRPGRKVARMPDGEEIKPDVPENAQPEVRTPEEFPVPKIDPANPGIPENATTFQMFKFRSYMILKGIATYLGNRIDAVTVMVNPAVIAEEACTENLYSSTCQSFAKFLSREKFCKFFPERCGPT